MSPTGITSLIGVASVGDSSAWEPFRGCGGCEGRICSILASQSIVRQLLDGQEIFVYEGFFQPLCDFANAGCSFARLLRWFGNDEHEFDRTIELKISVRNISQDGCRLIRVEASNHVDGYISGQFVALSTIPDDPASSVIDNIPVSTNPISPQNLQIFSSWKSSCDNGIAGHDQCVAATEQRTALPKRVIAVESDDLAPRLHISDGETGNYATLSYCWGGPQPHQTTKARLAEYAQGLPFESLPASIKDAIVLARILQIPYLWVDSLCIIQDSDEDKFEEVAQMANIFKRSTLTFAASRASSCHEGFLGVQEDTISRLAKSFKLPIVNLEDATGTVVMTPNRFQSVWGRGPSPLDLRCWTYQELLLSPRILSFHDDNVEWQCPSRLESNDMLQEEESSLQWDKASGRRHDVFRKSTLSRFSERMPQLWWEIVFNYTAGNLTIFDDKLLALSAIASEFQRLRPDQYLAGLWRSTLIVDLHWHRYPNFKRDGPLVKSRGRVTSFYVPTWSWASIDRGQITPLVGRIWPSNRVTIRECETFQVSPGAPFGLINGGRLVLSGPLKSLSIKDVCHHFSVGAWDPDIANRLGFIFADEVPHFRLLDDDADMDDDGLPFEDFLRRLGLPCGEKTLWFLGLSGTESNDIETAGLLLLKHEDGLFSRAGLFRIALTPMQQILKDRWGEDYVVTTISII